MTPTETEVKVRVAAAAARAALQRAGARLVLARVFEDNLLFDDPRGGVRAGGGILRLRRVPTGGVLTFKSARTVKDGLKTREEIETEVKDPDALQMLLERLGFRPAFRYQKYRETWSLLDQAVVVDETPIGDFIEIEGVPEGIHRAAEALGFSRADYVTDSYVALFFASGGQGDMVFGTRP
jgi:adenylate cyclase class 2